MRYEPLTERVYQRFLRSLLDGQWKAGDKLSEEALARDLGVSRTPVREVLTRLAQEGLVERRPRYGHYVKEFSRDEARDMFACRCLLETLGLDLGFQYIGEADLKPLEELIAAYNQADNLEEKSFKAIELDERMHDLIISSCPNQTLARFLKNLRDITRPFRNLRSGAEDLVEAAMVERQNIVNALRDGRKDDAIALLRRHLTQGGKMVDHHDAEKAGK